MAITEKQVAELVRQELGIPNTSQNPRFMWLIPRALDRLSVEVTQNPIKKHLLWTPSATVTAALDVNGKVSLTTLMTSTKIMLEFLDYGKVVHTTTGILMQRVEDVGIAGLPADNTGLYLYWLEGKTLATKNPAAPGTALTGTVTLQVPFTPTLAQLPEELEQDLVRVIVEMALKTPLPEAPPK